MFRKMRRYKQALSAEECVRILERGKTAVLGVIGDGGYPYTVPLNYVYEDGKIYFHGAKTGHKIDALRECAKVSVCVIDRDDVDAEALTTLYKSVIVFGRARILEDDDEIFHAAEALGLKFNPNKEYIAGEIKRERNILCCIEVAIEHMSGKQGKRLSEM